MVGGEEARPTLAEVRQHDSPRSLAESSVIPNIAMLGAEPIGYAQSYVALGSGDGWWEDESDPGIRGNDQSLADPARLGKGLGTGVARQKLIATPDGPAVYNGSHAAGARPFGSRRLVNGRDNRQSSGPPPVRWPIPAGAGKIVFRNLERALECAPRSD